MSVELVMVAKALIRSGRQTKSVVLYEYAFMDEQALKKRHLSKTKRLSFGTAQVRNMKEQC